MRIFVCLFIFLFVQKLSLAQENYEIQVYGSQTQPKGSTIIELHSNITLKGEKNIIDNVLPSNHSIHETLEITQGIGNIFEIGAYLFTNYTPGYGYKIIGTHIRPRIMAPAEWKLPVGLSLSTEIGFQKKEYSSEIWSMEIRPIIDKQWHKLYVSFNPTFDIALKSSSRNSVPAFEPNVKISYTAFSQLALGIEYYGEFGAINAFENLSSQVHAIFAAADLSNNSKWELNAGAGCGLTPASDGFIFKIIIGRKIFW